MRNYKSKPVISKSQMLQCPISMCNKKYKKEHKVQQHVEKVHYYKTINQNNFKFDHHMKSAIYRSAATYIIELDNIKNNISDGETFAKNLLPQVVEIDSDNLKRIMLAQTSFANKILKENLIDCDWKLVMKDFECFFNMGMPYYDSNFCPTLAIDFLWHALMQCPALYAEICNKSCKKIVPHCDIIRTAEQDMKRHEYFLDVFKHMFNRSPYQIPNSVVNFSSATVKEMFNNLQMEEEQIIIKEEEKRRLDAELLAEKKKRDNELLIQKMNERNELIKKISEHLKEDIEKFNHSEVQHYLDGYAKNLRDQNLRNYVKSQVAGERIRWLSRSGSTC